MYRRACGLDGDVWWICGQSTEGSHSDFASGRARPVLVNGLYPDIVLFIGQKTNQLILGVCAIPFLLIVVALQCTKSFD